MRQAGLLAVLALWTFGCGGGAPAAPPAPAEASTSGYFTVPEAQRAHVQIVAVQMADFATTVRTTGTVDWDNDHTTQAITQVSGPITRLAVDTGAHVKAGDPLLYVSSPDIANAVSTYRKAKNKLEQAQRALDRNKDLLAHKAIAQKDLEDSQADFNDAATDLATAMQTLKILGVSDAELKDAESQNVPVRSELPMRSPISGLVVQRLVLPGQVIQAGTTLAFVISNVNTVWVQAHVYEKDLKTVRTGDEADIRTAVSTDVFHGRVTYIGDLLDPATRTTLVRIVTANPSGLLKKDLFVDVTIRSGTQRRALVVPTSAILYDEQNFPFVYVDVGQGRFVQRLITIGAQQGTNTEVVKGLKPDERVVGQGSLFLQFANTIGK